jgi:hypothetical protein
VTDAERRLPEGRYGASRRRRPLRRRTLWLIVAAAIAVGAALAVLAYRNLGPAPITAQRVAFEEKPGNAMEITIDVSRDDASRPAVCIVRVRDISGAETGRKEVYVAPSESDVRLKSVVQSGTRPVTADVFGCSYAVPEYLSSRQRPTG